MKKVLFLFPVMMSFALASCSSDEPELGVEGTEPTPGSTECGYIAVNIVQPRSIGGRATDGFQNGTDDENLAKSARFFIFNAAGAKIAEQDVLLNGEGTATTPATERIYNTVLVIENETTKPEAKYLACVLNAPTGLTATTITELAENIGEYGAHTPGAFIMSNSVFTTEANNIATEVAADNIQNSAAAAMQHAVDIYVERVVARVNAEGNTDFKVGDDETNGVKISMDGTDKVLGIKITGIEVANIAEKSYLFKNVTGFPTDMPSTVWDATNKRSYWETVPSLTAAENDKKLTFTNHSYNDIVPTPNNFDITDPTQKWQWYIQPNTSTQKTSVLVTAELMDGTSPITDLVYMQGRYTTSDHALNAVAAHLAQKNYYKKIEEVSGETTVTKYRQLEATDFEWKNNQDFIKAGAPAITWLKSYEVVAQLTSSVTAIYDQDGQPVNDGVQTVNDYLKSETAKSIRARVFDNGKCYYFVEIDQTPAIAASSATKYHGVVRNHIYQLTLDGVKGVGTPVFDPTDVIIPEKTDGETYYYLAATVRVLSWKLVGQHVQFEGQQ